MFNDTATTQISTLSLHDALPILQVYIPQHLPWRAVPGRSRGTLDHRLNAIEIIPFPTSRRRGLCRALARSEEHTSELQSLRHLVCRLLLEKKKKMTENTTIEQKT